MHANVKHEFQNVPNFSFRPQTPCNRSEQTVPKIKFAPQFLRSLPSGPLRFSLFAFRFRPRPLDFCQIYWKSHNSPSYHSFCTRGQNLTGCTPSTSQFGLGANPHAPNSPTFPSIRASEPPETQTVIPNPGRNPCWEFSRVCGNLTTRARRRQARGAQAEVKVRGARGGRRSRCMGRAGMKNRDWRSKSLPL